MTLLDLDSLRLKKPLPPGRARAKPTTVPRHREGQRFLKGPIPWSWLLAAMQLPGAALHVAVFIWYQAGLKRSAQVELNQSALPIARTTARRGLAALQKVGLVSVVRHVGRAPRVTILEVGDD